MKLGFVYAGQGAQHVGMGQDFYEKFGEYKEVIDTATESVKGVCDVDIANLCFEGPEEKLSKTEYTQPAMVAFAVGVTKLLKKAGIEPEYCLGLSLGEYSALYEAGVFDEKTVLNLIAKRGKFMQEASLGREVKMSAVLGMDRDKVIDGCAKITDSFNGDKIVSAANFNCPGQIVISGDADAVDAASTLLKEEGAKRVVPLKVSGPFHTSIMKPAGDKLAEEFKNTEFGQMNTKVVFNCLGKEKDEKDAVASLLEKQVQSSVYLEDSIKYMAAQGVDTIVEIGPGKTISSFVKKTAPDIKVYNIDTVEDYENTVKELLA